MIYNKVHAYCTWTFHKLFLATSFQGVLVCKWTQPGNRKAESDSFVVSHVKPLFILLRVLGVRFINCHIFIDNIGSQNSRPLVLKVCLGQKYQYNLGGC